MIKLEQLTTSLADRYRIERELGAGGMATVYLAHDIRHGRQVAVKVLRPELAAVIGADRFLAEIRTTAALQHPHILPLFDSGATDGNLFYVMPFIEGETLRDRLHREKQLPIAEAVRVATEVATALDYAHRHGVIHRDIKPENILLHDGSALVADFGIALAASNAGGTRMTETGMSLGTPHYMSPEQAMGEREVTARSDVYALGAITYEMLLGEPPFTGPTAQSIVAKVMTERPVRLISRRERVPQEVEDAVMTALEKLPADRFASAMEFATALRTPVVRTQPMATGNTPGVTHRSNWRLPAILGVLLGAIGTAVAFNALDSSDAGTGTSSNSMRTQLAFTGRTGRGAISPDGQFVAYVEADCIGQASAGCLQSLFVKERGSDQPVRVFARAQNIRATRFTHDGLSLVFLATLDSARNGLFIMPRLGGLPRRIGGTGVFDTHASSDSIVQLAGRDGKVVARIMLPSGAVVDSIPMPVSGAHGIAWSPDGSKLAVVSSYTRLSIVQRDGTVSDSIRGPFRPTVRWSPDGTKALLFRALPVKEDDLAAYQVDDNGRISKNYDVLISAIQTLLLGEFDVARNSGDVVMTTGSANFDIWTFEVEQVSSALVQRTSGTTWYGFPAISPDGKHLYYLRGDGLGDNLYRLTLPNEEQSLTAQRFPGSSNATVSGDGRFVTFSNVGDSGTIVGFTEVASRQTIYTTESRAEESIDVTWVRDGYALISSSTSSFVMRNVNTGATRTLPFPDSIRPVHIAANVTGDSLAVLAMIADVFVIVTTPLDKWDPTWRYRSLPDADLLSMSWRADGSIYFSAMSISEEVQELWHIRSAGGAPVLRRSLPPSCVRPTIAVGANGQRGTCASRDMRGDVWLMQVPGVTAR